MVTIGQELLTDEFAVPETQQTLLRETVTSRLQRLFRVHLTVFNPLERGLLAEESRQIWVQLRGDREAVCRAKEYVKGLCHPELEETETYPKDMHCIFDGADKFFLHAILQASSADVLVVQTGLLHISGTAEAVIMAKSQVQQMVKLFHDRPCLPPELDILVKKDFRNFVESHSDKYAMELMLLPSSLKQELLTLSQGAMPTEAVSLVTAQADRSKAGTPVTELTNQILDTVLSDPTRERPPCKRRSSSCEERSTKRQFSSEVSSPCTSLQTDGDASESDDSVMFVNSSVTKEVSPETNYKCLVNFFKTMGYQQDIVVKVIDEMGQMEEPLVLLDRIAEESLRQTESCSKTKESLNQAGSSRAFKTKGSPSLVVQTQSPEDVETDGPFIDLTQTEHNFIARGNSKQHITQNPVTATHQLRGSSLEHPIVSPPLQGALTTVTHKSFRSSIETNTSPVTGDKRFKESLKTPYKLILENKPGREELKHIIIDGSNVAMTHGLHKYFSCRGIAIAVQFFWRYGHRHITVFVPQWRLRYDPLTTETHFLHELQEMGVLSLTPARMVCGKRIASHDDRFLLHLAEKTDGIIVTNDNLKEFQHESESWKNIIKNRLLQYTFVEDIFMIPDDPLGKHGPRLDTFLCKDSRCNAQPEPRCPFLPKQIQTPVPSQLLANSASARYPIQKYPMENPGPPTRSALETKGLQQQLYDIFPEQKQKIDSVLSAHPYMRDLNALSAMVLD
ncbi:NEDD4-binding protein 1 [Erpetoichthys calabaricus]|uniref:NEDD4-binding protein 1 n=1 Tax=Erpetoichthys calabaricus TaxID=27687 RepID=A0A8C4SP89_ERPCA|nr:NEDD4-binding protein 1 [Erpetoichthys calabaricus]